MNEIKSKKENIIIYLWTSLILSLFLRNIIPFYMTVLMIFGLLIAFFLIINNYELFPNNNKFNFIFYLFFFIILFQTINSYFFLNKNEYFKALPRFLLMPITFFFLYFFVKKKKVLLNIFKIYIFFYFLGCLSLIHQIYYDQNLSFLVDPHQREGLKRFGSTLGSLNVLPSTVFFPCIIIYCFCKNFFLKNIFIFFFLATSFFTLSKSAFVNIFFFLLFLLLRKDFLKLFIILILFFISIYFSEKMETYSFALLKSLYLGDIGNDEISQPSSLISQIFYRLDLINFINNMSFYKFFAGYGIVGGQGVFGLPLAFTGTTHNQYYDLITILGIFGLVCFLYIVKSNLSFLFSLKKKNEIAYFFFFCILISIINMFFFNGFLFNPYTSFFIWMSIVYQINKASFK